VIRAFFDFLKARKIKKMYLGKDIPVGNYAKALKDSHRSVAEQFLEWFVLKQDLHFTEQQLTADQVYEEFQKWQGTGKEFERSKSSITKELSLQAIDGVSQIRPRMQVWNETTDAMETREVRTYILDLDKLRKRYGIGMVDNAAPPPVQTIDCERDVSSWETARAQAAAEQDEAEEGEPIDGGPSGLLPSVVGEKRGRGVDHSDDSSEDM
jgi:hypothetical protein